ncbi:antitoxin VbhA family protein [Pseudooceanicola nanhaiensis]|uniref:antitoxin VbhA family protein n=1 Tax=Pseudooceanicola nanhaiensis TaxID=375761 RepID=UPI003514682E
MTVSKEKQEKRRESWRQANASVRIDGGTISPEFKALQERHIRGQITRAELRAELETMERTG